MYLTVIVSEFFLFRNTFLPSTFNKFRTTLKLFHYLLLIENVSYSILAIKELIRLINKRITFDSKDPNSYNYHGSRVNPSEINQVSCAAPDFRNGDWCMERRFKKIDTLLHLSIDYSSSRLINLKIIII